MATGVERCRRHLEEVRSCSVRSLVNRGTGVGTFTRPGATAWRGALFFETTSAALSRLNGIAVVFEYEVDEGGKSEGRFTEWK